MFPIIAKKIGIAVAKKGLEKYIDYRNLKTASRLGTKLENIVEEKSSNFVVSSVTNSLKNALPWYTSGTESSLNEAKAGYESFKLGISIEDVVSNLSTRNSKLAFLGRLEQDSIISSEEVNSLYKESLSSKLEYFRLDGKWLKYTGEAILAGVAIAAGLAVLGPTVLPTVGTYLAAGSVAKAGALLAPAAMPALAVYGSIKAKQFGIHAGGSILSGGCYSLANKYEKIHRPMTWIGSGISRVTSIGSLLYFGLLSGNITDLNKALYGFNIGTTGLKTITGMLASKYKRLKPLHTLANGLNIASEYGLLVGRTAAALAPYLPDFLPLIPGNAGNMQHKIETSQVTETTNVTDTSKVRQFNHNTWELTFKPNTETPGLSNPTGSHVGQGASNPGSTQPQYPFPHHLPNDGPSNPPLPQRVPAYNPLPKPSMQTLHNVDSESQTAPTVNILDKPNINLIKEVDTFTPRYEIPLRPTHLTEQSTQPHYILPKIVGSIDSNIPGIQLQMIEPELPGIQASATYNNTQIATGLENSYCGKNPGTCVPNERGFWMMMGAAAAPAMIPLGVALGPEVAAAAGPVAKAGQYLLELFEKGQPNFGNLPAAP